VAPFAVDFAASAVSPKMPSPADLLGGLPPLPSAPSLHVRGAGVRAERRGGINGEAQSVRVMVCYMELYSDEESSGPKLASVPLRLSFVGLQWVPS